MIGELYAICLDWVYSVNESSYCYSIRKSINSFVEKMT